jgi:hypothetical protein
MSDEARRVPVDIDDQGNIVEKTPAPKPQGAQPLRKAGRSGTKETTPPDQFKRSYVPGRTYTDPKTGIKHEDH